MHEPDLETYRLSWHTVQERLVQRPLTRHPSLLGRRQKLNHEERSGPKTTGEGMGDVPGVIRRLIKATVDGGWRHGQLVGQRYPCARDHLGGGGVEVFAADPH